MKGILLSIFIKKHALTLAALAEAVPVCAFEFLKDVDGYPAPEHALAFVVSFTALLFATGFSSMQLRKHALEADDGLTS